jgi:hypothetical protein
MADNGRSPEDVVNYFAQLLETNPEAGDSELDTLEQQDPELYNYVCDSLGLLEEGGDNV